MNAASGNSGRIFENMYCQARIVYGFAGSCGDDASADSTKNVHPAFFRRYPDVGL